MLKHRERALIPSLGYFSAARILLRGRERTLYCATEKEDEREKRYSRLSRSTLFRRVFLMNFVHCKNG